MDVESREPELEKGRHRDSSKRLGRGVSPGRDVAYVVDVVVVCCDRQQHSSGNTGN